MVAFLYKISVRTRSTLPIEQLTALTLTKTYTHVCVCACVYGGDATPRRRRVGETSLSPLTRTKITYTFRRPQRSLLCFIFRHYFSFRDFRVLRH